MALLPIPRTMSMSRADAYSLACLLACSLLAAPRPAPLLPPCADDKVGAALSMVYTSGAPIMFVGCGQTYVDLKRLNVKSVVKSLLK